MASGPWSAPVDDVLDFLFNDYELPEPKALMQGLDGIVANGIEPVLFGQWQAAELPEQGKGQPLACHGVVTTTQALGQGGEAGLGTFLTPAALEVSQSFSSSGSGVLLHSVGTGSSDPILLDGSSSGATCGLDATSMQKPAPFFTQPGSLKEETVISPGSSWQELLNGGMPPPSLTSKGGRGRGRGRGTSAAAITKPPCKDKKRENSILIKQLEQEVQAKLSLVKHLEGENVELKRKERLLQLSVDTSEHNMTRLADPQLAPNLKNLLMSFRGTYNRGTAERVLAKMANVTGPQDVTIQVFTQTWQALVMEMCDALMAESAARDPAAQQDAKDHLTRLCQQCTDFCMAICADSCDLIMRAQTINMLTGEEVEPRMELWVQVLSKLALNEEQRKDMVGAFDMFLRCCSTLTEERIALKAQLDALLARGQPDFDTTLSLAEHLVPVLEVYGKLRANLNRCHTVHTLVAFLALRLMTPKQVAQLCMHAAPLFPNLHMLLGVLKLQASPVPGVGAAQANLSVEYKTLLAALKA